jgi:RNA polymerase sigma-70 factor (ECF subfamily)
MATDEIELIRSAQKGDMTAFQQLVFCYDKQVISLAAHYVNNAEDAKDIYQEVFLRVYRGLPRFKFKSSFTTWLFRIVTNVCITYRQRRRRHVHQSLDIDSDSEEHTHGQSAEVADESTTDSSVLDKEIAVYVEEALQKLSPTQRMVFTLRYYQNYRLKEIASMLDCTEGAVKKYIFVATRRMRESLKEYYEEGR